MMCQQNLLADFLIHGFVFNLWSESSKDQPYDRGIVFKFKSLIWATSQYNKLSKIQRMRIKQDPENAMQRGGII